MRRASRRASWPAVLLCLAAGAAAGVETVDVVFLKKEIERLPKLSNLDPPPADDGALGGRQGVADNDTTGRFLGHDYRLEVVVLNEDDDAREALRGLHAKGVRQFVADVPAADLLAMADSESGRSSWFYNVGSGDDALRTSDCRANVLHVAPSHSMRADALAQYLIMKKWRRWFLVTGRRRADAGFADAVRRAATKFGGRIVAAKKWEYGPDARRTAASTVPLFTQDTDYDVLIVADVVGEFGEYLSLPHVATAPGGRHPGTGPGYVAPRPRAVGCGADTKPLSQKLRAAHVGERLRRVAGGARNRRGGDAHRRHRRRDHRGLYPRRRIRAGRLQGAENVFPQMESTAAPADTAGVANVAGGGVAAAAVSAPALAARHLGPRPTGNAVQIVRW